jgi:hypothetical protein
MAIAECPEKVKTRVKSQALRIIAAYLYRRAYQCSIGEPSQANTLPEPAGDRLSITDNMHCTDFDVVNSFPSGTRR